MTRTSPAQWLVAGAGVCLWLALVALPLGLLYSAVLAGRDAPEAPWPAERSVVLAVRGAALAAAVAVVSVLLGYSPGRIMILCPKQAMARTFSFCIQST